MPGNSPQRLLRIAALAAAVSLPWSQAFAGQPDIYERETRKPLSEVVEDAEFAIVERNFRVTGNLHIGKAIRERDGGDFPDYEVVLFCNLGYAREMLELNPEFVNFCPGRVTVRGAGAATIVSAPLLPQNTGDPRLDALMKKLNTFIREIVDYAAESWIQENR